MAIEYAWTIPTTEYDVKTGGIKVAHWRVTGTDGEHSGSSYGTAGFTPDPDQTGFKPFEKITEEDVLTWVWGSVSKDDIEKAIADTIETQKNPTEAAGTPWG